MKRTLVTMHLPLEMGAVSRVMMAIAEVYPDAVVETEGPELVRIVGEDSPWLRRPHPPASEEASDA